MTALAVDVRLAAARLSRRPAPWHEEPNVSARARFAPAETSQWRPTSPGMMTGWPTSLCATGVRRAPPGTPW